jgi:hypothetical protein
MGSVKLIWLGQLSSSEKDRRRDEITTGKLTVAHEETVAGIKCITVVVLKAA